MTTDERYAPCVGGPFDGQRITKGYDVFAFRVLDALGGGWYVLRDDGGPFRPGEWRWQEHAPEVDHSVTLD